MFLFSVAITLTSVYAQSSQMATLLHKGTITNYYSSTAFIDAMEEAEDGDVISLSSGAFEAADIEKNLTIRGAGITVPGINDNEIPTVILGNLSIDIPESTPGNLSLEGIYFNGDVSIGQSDGLTVNKCQIQKLYANNRVKGQWNDFKFLHCVISEIDPTNTDKYSMNFVNSVITKQFNFRNDKNKVSQFTNCVITSGAGIGYAHLINSVLIMEQKSAYSATVEASCTLNNCIIAKSTKYMANQGGNKFLSQSDGIFDNDTFYQLSSAMDDIKGTDGKVVGIYGGNLPFTPATSRPRITKFNVGSKTTADGKLSVDIEIKAED